MGTLKFRFYVGNRRVDDEREGLSSRGSPRFVNWSPMGAGDAISVPLGDDSIELTVWHDEHAYYQAKFGGEEEQEKAEKLRKMDERYKGSFRQGSILCGMLSMTNVSDDLVAKVKADAEDDEACINLGMQVAECMYAGASRYLNILRYRYGQHWVPKMPKYRGGEQSLQQYLLRHELRWHNETTGFWHLFAPEAGQPVTMVISYDLRNPETQGITKEDWVEIQKLCADPYEPSIAARLLARSRQLREENSLRLSLIEAATALEVAVNNFFLDAVSASLRGKLPANSKWKDLNRPALTVLAGSLAGAEEEHIEGAVELINERNALMHAGAKVSENAEHNLHCTHNVIIALLKREVKKQCHYYLTSIDDGCDEQE